MLWKIVTETKLDKIINYESNKVKTFNESQHILSTHNSPSPE